MKHDFSTTLGKRNIFAFVRLRGEDGWRMWSVFTCSWIGVLHFVLVSFEADLEHPVAECVSVKWLDGYETLVIVGHRYETESLALVRLEVANNLDVLKSVGLLLILIWPRLEVACNQNNYLDSTERSKKLPQNVLLGVRSKIVDKDAPSGTVHRCSSRSRGSRGSCLEEWIACQQVASQRRVSVKERHFLLDIQGFRTMINQEDLLELSLPHPMCMLNIKNFTLDSKHRRSELNTSKTQTGWKQQLKDAGC